MKQGKLPELLAPAGSPEALDAAIEAGADAVYFGAGSFNARMRAKNFTEGELADALSKCVAYGVKTYVTVNTRVKDPELPAVLSLAEDLYLGGAAALIVADIGAASMIRERIPRFELHASTQLSGHSVFDAAELQRLGFSRMVCPREISCRELASLCSDSPIEIEAFVHGAHCVSFSGQCLMSFAMGGRSGNRGMCAQPCRLPFSIEGVKNSHPLSLKDMCLAGDIPELISCGVSSLKIEGRQKSADYVYGVTKIYRRLLDERRRVSEQELRELSDLFSRDGFSDGYFKGNYRSMLGVRDEDERPYASGFPGLTRKIPLDAKLVVKEGERPVLSYTDGKRTASAEGEVSPRREAGVPMDPAVAREKAGKLGGTPFVLRSFETEIDDSAAFSLSELNAMRREAVKSLSSPNNVSKNDFSVLTPPDHGKKSIPARRILTAEFADYSQIPGEAFEFFDKIYVPLTDAKNADGEKICVAADPLTYDTEAESFVREVKAIGGEVLVNGMGQAELAVSAGAVPVGSFRLNVTNSRAAEALSDLLSVVTVSPESPAAICRDIAGETSLIVYGKLPLMHTERCALSDGGAVCPFGGAGGRTYPHPEKRAGKAAGKFCDGTRCLGVMTDRTGTSFEIRGLSDCSNIIYNSAPIYMADKKEFLDSCFADRLHFIFTTESKAECAGVIAAYKNGLPPRDTAKIRRLK
ncbi:MAG: U32 family peptidase [Clostridia bacterium]|nr:U32 family peptidase [Clostridia bacterium]